MGQVLGAHWDSMGWGLGAMESRALDGDDWPDRDVRPAHDWELRRQGIDVVHPSSQGNPLQRRQPI